MIILAVIGALLLLYLLWQAAELRLFNVTEYEIASEKVKSGFSAAVLSDLHGFSYGKENERLVSAVKEAKPDLILIPGDLATCKCEREYKRAASLLPKLSAIAPVFYSYGNHELFAQIRDPRFSLLKQGMKKSGAVILNNAFSTEEVKGEEVRIYGLSLPEEYFETRKEIPLSEEELAGYLGPLDESVFSILMAHDPLYAEQYFSYGTDLTVCGHNHGGLVCLPNGRSVISPRFRFFPEYGAGHFEKEGKHLVVSRGLGTHKYHVRIFNRAELVVIRVRPEDGRVSPGNPGQTAPLP